MCVHVPLSLFMSEPYVYVVHYLYICVYRTKYTYTNTYWRWVPFVATSSFTKGSSDIAAGIPILLNEGVYLT